MTHTLSICNQKDLEPGKTYIINQNEYNNNRINIKCNGTKEKPITIQAEPNTLITDKTFFKIIGDYLILQGFTFRNLNSKNPLRLNGNNIIFRNNVIEEIKQDMESVINVTGENVRITNNTFRIMNFKGNVIKINNKNKPLNCLIDNNNFSDRFDNLDEETILIGNSTLSIMNTMVYNNKFNNMESMLINNNSSKNVICYNTISSCSGRIFLNGLHNTVMYNYINGNKKPKSFGLTINDEHQTILGNTFENLTSEEIIYTPININCGKVGEILIEHNDFFGCFNCFAIGNGNKKKYKPRNLDIINNRIIKCNYMFNKNKDLKGYGENVNIMNNRLFNTDQKLRLHLGLNQDNIYDIKQFIADTLKNKHHEKYQNEEKRDIDLTPKERLQLITLKKSKKLQEEIKILESQFKNVLSKLKNKREDLKNILLLN